MWVVDMQKTLDGADLPAMVEKWPRHCIFRVPPRFRAVHSGVYKPQAVALGPFHHGDSDLVPMEAHKRRAVAHLLRRAGRTLAELAAAVEAVAGDLEDAYEGLGGNRDAFLEMMVADGCLLLEVMRRRYGDYAPGDPVFSRHAVGHIAPFVQRDMLMIENQLPLLLLHKIAAVEGGEGSDESSINREVLKFLGVDYEGAAVPDPGLIGLHPLDLYHRSLLSSLHRHEKEAPYHSSVGAGARAAPRSAQRLWEAGVRFRRSSSCLNDIDFDNGRRRLEMPEVSLDDSTEYKFHNMMAFEALHGATGNDVTAFVLFIRDMVDSAGDVALLAREGILWHDLAGGDAAVASLFNGLTRDVAKTGESRLCAVRDGVERYCNESWRVFVFESWAKLKNTYFTSLWASVALTVFIFLLITDVMQTAYAVMSYEMTKHRHG